MTRIVERPLLLYPLAAAAAAVLGALTFAQPRIAAGLLAVALVAWIAARRPVGNLVAILFLTAIVPYGTQKLLGVSRPGLLPSDLLLIVGMAWGLLAAMRIPLDGRWRWFGVAIAVYIALAVLQAVHGFRAGRSPSDIGVELRVQLGFGAFFAAVPILRDPVGRRRLFKGMAVLAVLLGLWGIVQYTVNIPFGGAQDFGVRAGVALTSGGRGQVQGGLYGFGVAIVMCAAALLSGEELSARARAVLWAGIATCSAGLLFTFERTFWVATVLGVGLVVLRAGRMHRARALIVLPMGALVALVGLSMVAPNEFTVARERLLSIGQYTSDNSVRFRVVESRHVLDQISAHPVAGSGLAASVYWGKPWLNVPPSDNVYTHDGYLWLIWKMGIPIAALLFAIIGAAVLYRRPPPLPPLERGLRNGAQAALVSLLITSITFPAFNTLAISAVMGVLLALAVLPPRSEPDVSVV